MIHNGRFTAVHDGPLAVFLIGMRVNRPLALRRWLPVFMAMPPMLRRLHTDPALGFLGGSMHLAWKGAMLVQYWRSFDALEQFARDPAEPHRAAWQRFNRAVGNDGSVGVWHETFQVAPGAWEAIYVNMPRTGLAAATGHVGIDAARDSARRRITQ